MKSIHTTDGKSVAKLLKDFEIELGTMGFIRVNKSFLVNKAHIEKVMMNDKREIVLTGGNKVYVSRRRKSFVMKALTG